MRERWLVYRRGGLGDTLLTFPLLELLKRSGKRVWAVGNTDYYLIAKEVGWADAVSSEVPQQEFERKVFISFGGDIDPFPPERVWLVEYYLRSLGLEGEFSKSLPLSPLESSPLRGCAVLHPSSGSPRKNPPLELFFQGGGLPQEERPEDRIPRRRGGPVAKRPCQRVL